MAQNPTGPYCDIPPGCRCFGGVLSCNFASAIVLEDLGSQHDSNCRHNEKATEKLVGSTHLNRKQDATGQHSNREPTSSCHDPRAAETIQVNRIARKREDVKAAWGCFGGQHNTHQDGQMHAELLLQNCVTPNKVLLIQGWCFHICISSKGCGMRNH